MPYSAGHMMQANTGGIKKMKKAILPPTNDSGYYEIRLESIGGLGANLCASMLGAMGVFQLGLNSASFSSYGSEKTGTPVKGYVRYAQANREIRTHAPVKHPHLLAVFHDALLKNKGVLDGCFAGTRIVVNTQEETKQETPFLCIPAQRIARETHSRVNTVMLGALTAAMEFAGLEEAEAVCRDMLGKKYPDMLSANLEGICRGFQAAEKELEKKRLSSDRRKSTEKRGKKYSVCAEEEVPTGYLTMPLGGINPWYGNSVIADLSASGQGYIPLFVRERCINCARCDAVCPDMVFQFKPGVYRGRNRMINCGLDYYHCKGCLRCVQVCPVDALVRGEEAEHPDKKWFMPNQRLLRTPDYYVKAGPDGYITSESFSSEKRMGEEGAV